MNRSQWERLLQSAKSAGPPVPSSDFDERVVRKIRREPRPEQFSLVDQLGELFPRLGLAAAILIGVCAAAELCFTTSSELTTGITQLSEQWLFAAKGD